MVFYILFKIKKGDYFEFGMRDLEIKKKYLVLIFDENFRGKMDRYYEKLYEVVSD